MTTNEVPIASAEPTLLRVVGFWSLTASIVNLSIGGSIFVLQGVFARTLGVAAPLVFVLGGLVFIQITMCFAAAGSRVSSTGGPYSYVQAAFGPFASFVTGSVFWVANVAGVASLVAAILDQVASIVPALSQPLLRIAAAFVGYLLLCILNARGIRAGVIAIMMLAAVKLLPLAALVVFGAPQAHAINFHGTSTITWSTIGSSMIMVIYCFSGMETALLPSGEVKNPSRVVPRAALVAITVVVLLSVGLQIVAQGVLGDRLANNPAPLAALANELLHGSYNVILLAAGISIIGCLQGDLVGSSRLLYALARDGFLPSWLSHVTVRRRVPLLAIAAHATAVVLLTCFGSFESLALMSGGAMCIVYFGSCASAWVLQRRDIRESGVPFMLPGGALIPAFSCVAMALTLTTLERSQWQAIGSALAIVITLYIVTRWRRAGVRVP
ncbi:MAG: APC family permease [Gammaproteobacteria bacterium]